MKKIFVVLGEELVPTDVSIASVAIIKFNDPWNVSDSNPGTLSIENT